MTNVEKQQILKANKDKFGDLPEEVLLNINPIDGVLTYYIENGVKIYDKSSRPRTSGDPAIICDQYFEKSLTQQQFHDDVSLKAVLKRYGVLDKQIPNANLAAEYFQDLSILPKDLTEAHNLVKQANEMFLEIPAQIRRELDDKPENLLALSQTVEGLKKLHELGLGVKLPEDDQASDKKPVPSAGAAGGSQTQTP